MILCDYGCGQEGKYQFKNGKWCCSKSHNKCPINKDKNSITHKGRKFTKEHKEKLSNTKMGKYRGVNSPQYGKVGYWKNKKRPEISGKNSPNKRLEVRKKISKSNKGRPSHRKGKKLCEETRSKMSLSKYKELNPNWKGGKSFEPYCEIFSDKEYREFIKQRDGYKCLNPDCTKKSKILSIHHIDYNKQNCDQKNLITTCISCNSRANKDREWHTSWYRAIIYRRYKII